MQGKRKYPGVDGELLLGDGEYGFSPKEGWLVRPPGNHTGSVSKHTIVEHEDGTITVSPSILIDDGRNKWHGYLEKGVWRQA